MTHGPIATRFEDRFGAHPQLFWAPAGTPEPILDKLNAAVIKVLADPAIREQLDKSGVPIMPPYSRAEAARFMQAESDKWVPIVRASGARVD